MKSRTFAFASLLALSALAVGPVAQPAMAQEEPLKIAVVNMDQVVAESAAGSALNEKLKAFQGGGEHGPHAVRLSPDGKSLYVIAGNHTNPPKAENRLPGSGVAVTVTTVPSS